MAIHIQIDKKSINNTENAKIQSVPCKIYADVDASISTYFEPYVKTTKDGRKYVLIPLKRPVTLIGNFQY